MYIKNKITTNTLARVFFKILQKI